MVYKMADQESARADLRLALSSLTVPDLQRELQKRHLKKSGKKEQLINRLLDHMEQTEKEKDNEEQNTVEESSIGADHANRQVIEETPVDPETDSFNDSQEVKDDKATSFDEGESRDSEQAEAVNEQEEITMRVVAEIRQDEHSIDVMTVEEKAVKHPPEQTEEHKYVNVPESPTREDKTEAKESAGSKRANSQERELPCHEVIISVKDNGKESLDGSQEEPLFEIIMQPSEEDQAIVSQIEEESEQAEEHSEEAPKVEQEEERANKGEYISIPERRYSAPVPLKKRRDPSLDLHDLTSSMSSAKKRRWGSSAEKTTVTISSESIKALIPEVKLSPSALDADVDFSEDDENREEGEIDESAEQADEMEKEKEEDKEEDKMEDEEQNDSSSETGNIGKADEHRETSIPREKTESGDASEKVGENEVKPSGKRIVRLGGSRKVFLKSTDENPAEAEEGVAKPQEITIQVDRKPLLPVASGDNSGDERERSAMEPKNPPSRSLHIQNLVRPFTVRNLQEHIAKTGAMVEGQFWIDKIKSHCYVTLETEVEAAATIKALDGIRWPNGSPKVLAVDYALNSSMYQDTFGAMGNAPESQEEKGTVPVSENPVLETVKVTDPTREITEKRSKRKEEKREQRGDRRKKEPSPTKLLDDLFRKTKATPCIYWLPLSEAQIELKEKEREARLVERRQARDQEAATRERERLERHNERQGDVEGADPEAKQATRPGRFAETAAKGQSPNRPRRRASGTQSPNRSPQRRPYRVHSPVGGPLTRRS